MARPKGSKTQNIPVINRPEPIHCPVCGSIEKEGALQTITYPYAGIVNGREYTKVIRRRIRCADCGQIRIERSCE